MINQNSPIIQNMIANGLFGYNGPNNGAYQTQQPMYDNNYYQQPQQQYYSCGYQQVQQPNYNYQPQIQQPIYNGNYYQQQQMMNQNYNMYNNGYPNSYGYYQQPQQQYYNEYQQMPQQNMYNNGYQQQPQMQQQQSRKPSQIIESELPNGGRMYTFNYDNNPNNNVQNPQPQQPRGRTTGPECLRGDYNNPYGDTFKNQQGSLMEKFKNSPYAYGTPDINAIERSREIAKTYGYDNNQRYGNNTNVNYEQMYMNPFQRQREEQIRLYKMKLSIASTYFGHPLTDEEMNNIIFPPQNQEPQKPLTDEERVNNSNYEWCEAIVLTAQNPYREPTNAELTAQFLYQMSKNMHDELDDHGLCQFLEEDLWKLQREYWLRENIDMNNGRDLSKTYSSKDYNELLAMHENATKDGFITQLLDNNRYDNNNTNTDVELGMAAAFEQSRRRGRNVLEEKVPTFISSEETQERRRRFTDAIMKQIYKKNGGGGN